MNIFVLLPRFPYPLEKGDKLRAYHQIRHLSKNHEVHLCAINDVRLRSSDIEALRPYCKTIHVINISKPQILYNIIKAFFTGNPLQVGYFYSSRGQHRIRTLLNEIQPDHIYCQLLRVAEYVKRSPIAKTLDYQDVFSKGAQRRSMTAPFFMRPLLRFEYKRLLKYEHEIFDLFDNKTIISVPDRDLIPHPERDQIAVVINGVDTDFFTPREVKPEYDIVFTGNMGYPPNVDAAVYLARDVLPRVLEKRPGTTLTLAGATPHSSVQALKSDHVKVTGWVEDIRDCYAKARLFIAPMRIGTGLQNKLLEAMAMRIPSITSPLANQALDATHGQEVLVGNSTDEYATLILQLLEDEKLARQIADNGHRFIHEKYDWAAATQVLEDLIVKS